MTLRQYINRRLTWAVLGCGAVALAAVFVVHAATSPSNTPALGAIFLLGSIGALSVVASRMRCPKCRARIDYIDSSPMRRYQARIKRDALDYCKCCGLGLDDQVPGPCAPARRHRAGH